MSGLAALGQITVSLMVVLAVLFAFGFILKKINSIHLPSKSGVKVISSTSVGPKERVVVVQMQDTWLVLGVAPGHVSLLNKTDAIVPPEPVATDIDQNNPCAGQVFRNVLGKYLPSINQKS